MTGIARRIGRPRVRRWMVLAGISAGVVLVAAWTTGSPKRYHGDEFARGTGIGLVSGNNTYFMASGNCYGCHGIDTMGAVWANHDAQGRDVNVPDAWRSTMMGNSARDPFWLAKVSHEVVVNPAHQGVIEDRCTACHAPLGRHNKHLTGAGLYTMDELYFDLVAQDGVSCMACHKQHPDSVGRSFSGDLHFDTTHVIYGPYDEVFTGAMQSFLNITPMAGAHISKSALCAGCHTLINNTVDINGNFTGDSFVEQATYHEWLNSAYGTEGGPNAMTCQGCHVPRTNDGIVIAALYDWLTPHSPFGEHHLAGANTFMLQLLKNNISALGLTASDSHFDTTIARTTRMLQQNSLLLNASIVDRDADTARVDVQLTNLAGHKFPSGYPSRRAFIEVLMIDDANDTLFRSGAWNGAYEVIGHDAEWEPHHDLITSDDQAQIYEMVMGDVNGDKTTALERAKEPLKDNRLPPLGFTSTHFAYDTAIVAGVGGDVDFNRNEDDLEGSGTDITHYHAAMNGYTGPLHVVARVWYQSAPRRWMEEMFSHDTPTIDAFQQMYDDPGDVPVLVKGTSLFDPSLAVDGLSELGLRIFPNPASDGIIWVDGMDDRVESIELRDMRGALISTHRSNVTRTCKFELRSAAGTYMIIVRTKDAAFVKRIVRP